jgi:hypothetical protein
MAQQSNPPDRTESSTTEQNGGITRRSYVRSIAGGVTAKLGTTIGGATKASLAAMGTVAASDHEVIRARGQTIRIGQGESFENALIDLTTDDSIALLVDGGNAVIRNVGFRGLYRGVDVPLTISAPRGTVLVECLYLGDGATGGGSDHGPGAIVYHPEAGSDVTFRRCNVQGWPNGGFDCSHTLSDGSATFESCYGKNNGVATFRCAGSSDSIRNCVGYNDDTDYGSVDGDHATRAGHPVWVWPPGTVTIEASHFASEVDSEPRLDSESGASGGTRDETRAGDVDPELDLSIPEGVPTSAEEAATD